MSKAKLLTLTGYFLFLVFFISLFFSFRAISGFALALLLIWALTSRGIELKWNAATLFLLAGLLYFIIGILPVLRLPGQEKWDHVLLQAGLLLTGLATYLSLYSKKLNWDFVFLLLTTTLALTLLYCLTLNIVEFSKSGDLNLFFYHSLVQPARQHAIYFSIYVFTAIVYLFESVTKNKLHFHKAGYFAAILFFSISLFLLSSKLVIGFCLFYFLVQFFQQVFKKKNPALSTLIIGIFLSLAGLALFTKNPVGNRFREIFKRDASILARERYDPGDYLNGVQFRLLQWKLVKEILDEDHAWVSGVGSGNSQNALDKKYIERNMYIGDAARNDRGYLGYNTHNQFLEALLQNGIPGILAFTIMSILLLRMAWEKRKSGFAIVFLLVFVYSLTESVLETQYGIILFSFLPLFLYRREQTF